MLISDKTPRESLLAPRENGFIFRDGKREKRTENVLRESRVSVIINGVPAWRVVCLAEYLPELVLGRLLTEGIIAGAEDVNSITVHEDGTAEVILRRASETEEKTVLSAGIEINDAPLPTLRGAAWEPEWIFALADRFAEGMPLHEETFATHSALLGAKGKLIFACEDIGRHNAQDKAIGYAARNGIDPAECYLYSSGRVPTDMVSKAIRAGVPILASKAAPTAEAIDLAAAHGLTLICSARRDRMKVLCDGVTE